MSQIRVVHYLNQFFAGMGGEARAGLAPGAIDGPVGPGVRLNQLLQPKGSVVATVYSGDNYATERPQEALDQVIHLIADLAPDVVVAGPAFASGRYSLACGSVCVAVRERLQRPCLTAMYDDAPGVGVRTKRVVVVPTSETAVGMEQALASLARLALKLGAGQELDEPSADGYLPMGIRQNEFSTRRAADRAVTMLLKKVRGEPFVTEWPQPHYDLVPAPPPLPSSVPAPRIALVSEGGVVPKGNPDGFPGAWARMWTAYSIAGLADLKPDAFESIHGGFDTSHGNADPDRLIPLDVMRDMEREGNVNVENDLYSTVGNMGSTETMRQLGVEIAAKLEQAGVDAVIVGAT